ncbi:uncharacterized protein YjbI with pentapeptide repeats [Amycolatopsis jiangsuensis]|uniref:Uncharacterized protein YjbI with pentapeptide repeats n=1 Tax=Amycolatopsis jiangsuensis TaxID=1181879 RepID=A0A840J5J1_9PSEU|nr:uncharacterized protein YjbI with pentapeptide repeats [Amycolatopsis jiangsuensis]
MRKWRGAGIAAATVVALGAVVWFFGVPVPEWAVGPPEGVSRVEWLTAVNSARSAFLTSLSIAAALVTAGLGIRKYFQDRDKQRLEEDKHLISQFDTAWGRLASADPLVRANSVRTLFRLMSDSPRDRPSVLRSVCDLLRKQTEDRADDDRAEADVVAAVDLLRERSAPGAPDPLDLANVRLPHADLRGAPLRGALVGKAILSGANLADADLRESAMPHVVLRGATGCAARFDGATLDHADLRDTHLRGMSAEDASLAEADFRGADLSGAVLRGAVLRRARLSKAKLDRIDITGADLTGADLAEADLSTVAGLTAEQLAHAVGKPAALPPHLRK